MNCPVCSSTLDRRRVKLTQDGPTVNHYAGTCACGAEITATVRVKARQVHAENPAVVPGSTYLRRHAPVVARR